MEPGIPFLAGDVSRTEIYRYLGLRGNEPDEATGLLVGECIDELMTKIRPRSFSLVFPLTVTDDISDLSCFKVQSKSLANHLRGCVQVLLFAATLGDGPDFLIRRYKKVDMTRSVVLQAASAAMTETFCDVLNDGWKEEFAQKGFTLRRRFSPGYGDFPLSVQRLFSDVLKMEKTTGISLTDGFLMLPTKSVTAVIGMEKNGA